MNILNFSLDIWKLFAEQIGCLELKNLLFVNKELFEKVPLLVGTNSLAEYEKVYAEKYYKLCNIYRYNSGDYLYIDFCGNANAKTKILNTLCAYEKDVDYIAYKNIDFKYRQKYVLDNSNTDIWFTLCINLPHTFTGNNNRIQFTTCFINTTIFDSKKLKKLHYHNCTLSGSVMINNNVHTIIFNKCRFREGFKIIVDSCKSLLIEYCDGYELIIEGIITNRNINNNNFIKIEN